MKKAQNCCAHANFCHYTVERRNDLGYMLKKKFAKYDT